MSFNIKAVAAVAKIFVHLRNPETDAKLYAPKLQADGQTPETDEQGNIVFDRSKPVGVRMYSPGSLQYRNAQSSITTENIKRGKKGLTGEVLRENAAELLALTTAEFVNMDYNGASSGVETFRDFYNDVEMIAYKEQIEEAQGDVGNSYKTSTTA